jgi:lysophospholipase L1-like esterase
MKPVPLKVILVVALCAAAPAFVGAAGVVTYTAFGDSIAFGAFASLGRGYVPLYAKAVANDNGVTVNKYNFGVPGWTSLDLRNALSSNAVFRLAAFSSKVITVNVGGSELSAARGLYKQGTCGGVDNEDCLHAAVLALETNWDSILDSILALRHNRPTVVRAMDIYNPYVNVDKASDTWPAGGDGVSDFNELKPYLDDINAYIAGASTAKGVLVAPVYAAFNGANGDEDPNDKALLAFDHFHPNNSGHALIASLLRSLGYSTVTP